MVQGSDGAWYAYFGDDTVRSISTYKNGEEVFEKTFYKNGQKASEGSYKGETQQGVFSEKIRHDLWIGWDESGKIISARSYRYGKILFETRWNSKGELLDKNGKN